MFFKPKRNAQGMKVWQLVLSVVAIALVVRVSMGALPENGYNLSQAQPSVYPPSYYHYQNQYDRSRVTPIEPAIEVLQFNLDGEVPGPLLSSILKRYVPRVTPDQAEDLRCTLPPSADPRMIMILPEEAVDDHMVF